MKKKINKKCAKCGSSPEDDPNISLHRFPRPNQVNKARCEAWAKFCYPNKAWSSPKFLSKLYSDHKMLCDKHFKNSSFTNSSKCLVRGSIPEKKYSKKTPQVVKQATIETVDLAEPESPVQIKIEPIDDDGIVIHVHSVEPRNHLKRKQDPLETENETFPIQKHRQQENNDDDDLFVSAKSPKKVSLRRNIDNGSYSDDVYDGRSRTKRASWQRNRDDDNYYNTKQSKKASQERNIAEDDFHYEPTNSALLDDCELYGKLLTQKLRTYSLHERNLMMFKIDGLLIQYPPGFETIFSLSDATSKKKTLKSPFSNLTIKKEKKNMNKEISPQPSLQTKILEESSSPVMTTSMPSLSPAKSIVLNQPLKVISSKSNQQVKLRTSLPIEPVQSKNSITSQSLKFISSMHNQPVKVTKSIPNNPVNAMTYIPDQFMNSVNSDTIKAKNNISNYPVRVTSSIQNSQMKITSTPNQPAIVMISTETEPEKVINKTPNEAVKIIRNILNPSFPNRPVKVLSSIPNEPVRIVNNVQYQPAEVTNIHNQKSLTQSATSVLSPLHISIPKTKVLPVTVSKYVPSSAHSRGQIRIIKSKSATISSSQPPILITVPKLSKAEDSTHESDVHPLDQLSSIAADHASQQYNISYGFDTHGTSEDINVVSHEVVLTSQETELPSQNIVETAFKNANINENEF